MRLIILSLALTLPAVALAAAPPSPIVQKLIDQLGDDDAAVRKDAEKKLDTLGDDVIAALCQACTGHKSDIAGADHCDFHGFPSPLVKSS